MEQPVTKLFTTSAAAAAFAAFAWTATAYATESAARASDAPSEVVKFDRAEFSTASGADAVYDRINTAAWHVCRDMYEANTMPESLQRLQCIDELVDTAVKDVNNPKLTAVYREKAGGSYTPAS
jgi:UrcA family protein